MKDETKKLLQTLAENTGISTKQIVNDYNLLYFTNKKSNIRERKTVTQLHNYYISKKKKSE